MFCNWHPLNTNFYGTTFGMPGSFNFSHINACVMGISVLGPRFISSEGLGLYKLFSQRGFEPSTFRTPGKRCMLWPRFPIYYKHRSVTLRQGSGMNGVRLVSHSLHWGRGSIANLRISFYCISIGLEFTVHCLFSDGTFKMKSYIWAHISQIKFHLTIQKYFK